MVQDEVREPKCFRLKRESLSVSGSSERAREVQPVVTKPKSFKMKSAPGPNAGPDCRVCAVDLQFRSESQLLDTRVLSPKANSCGTGPAIVKGRYWDYSNSGETPLHDRGSPTCVGFTRTHRHAPHWGLESQGMLSWMTTRRP